MGSRGPLPPCGSRAEPWPCFALSSRLWGAAPVPAKGPCPLESPPGAEPLGPVDLEQSGPGLGGEPLRRTLPHDARMFEHIDAVGMRQGESDVLLAEQHGDVGGLAQPLERFRQSARGSPAPGRASARPGSAARGCIIRARAIASICCSPPDSVPRGLPLPVAAGSGTARTASRAAARLSASADAGRRDRDFRARSSRRTVRGFRGIARCRARAICAGVRPRRSALADESSP